MTPGAGVTDVIRPGKRLRAAHRLAVSLGNLDSLRTFVRLVARTRGPDAPIANRWLDSKGIRP